MRSEFLETGQIVNTHGIAGEVKIMPWSDGPEFLLQFPTLYMDGKPLEITSARVHKNMVLAKIRGVDSVEAAMKLKGKVLFVARADVKLAPGQFFLADVVGLTVKDEAGHVLGTVKEVLSPSRQNVYVIAGPEGERMIPAVPEFIRKMDLEAGEMTVRLIEGM